jgi:hypothetical protein
MVEMKRGGDHKVAAAVQTQRIVVLEQFQGERVGGHVYEEVGRRWEWALGDMRGTWHISA